MRTFSRLPPDPNRGARGQENAPLQQPVFVPMKPSLVSRTHKVPRCVTMPASEHREASSGVATGAQVTNWVGAEVQLAEIGDGVMKLNHSRTAAAGN